MKKALLASALVLALGGCAVSPSNKYIDTLSQQCKIDLGIKKSAPSSRETRCIQEKLNADYSQGKFNHGQDYFNRSLNMQALLSERYEKGEITESQAKVAYDSWVQMENEKRQEEQARESQSLALWQQQLQNQENERQRLFLMNQQLQNNRQIISPDITCNSSSYMGNITTHCN